MKEELYQWIWNLAVFYILFTAILHLAPDGKYEKYVRFFMGLLLIYMLCTPVFAVFGASQKNPGIFAEYWNRSAECGSKYKRGENTGRDHRKGRTCAGAERKDC